MTQLRKGMNWYPGNNVMVNRTLVSAAVFVIELLREERSCRMLSSKTPVIQKLLRDCSMHQFSKHHLDYLDQTRGTPCSSFLFFLLMFLLWYHLCGGYRHQEVSVVPWEYVRERCCWPRNTSHVWSSDFALGFEILRWSFYYILFSIDDPLTFFLGLVEINQTGLKILGCLGLGGHLARSPKRSSQWDVHQRDWDGWGQGLGTKEGWEKGQAEGDPSKDQDSIWSYTNFYDFGPWTWETMV